MVLVYIYNEKKIDFLKKYFNLKHRKHILNNKMSRKIVFDPINFEDDKQKKATQYTTSVGLMKDGKKVYPDEVTGFIFQEYSGFAPAKFNPPESRDWIRIPIIEEDKSCVELMNTINEYDDAFDKQKDIIFGKFSKLYNHVRSVKEPKEEDELEMEANADKPKKPKHNTVKFKLKMGWNYYYEGERLDYTNTSSIRKTVSDALAKNNDKKIIDDLIVTLKFTEEDGKKSEKKVKMSDIESRKEISTKVYYRKAENVSDAKKVNECADNDELEKFYGKPEEMTVKSPEDLDKYHRSNCYVRYLYGPSKVWASKSKGDDGKRRSSLQFVCHQIDIIHIKQANSSQSTVRSIYSGYGFGSRNETVFNAVEKEVAKEVTKNTKGDDSDNSDSDEELKKPVSKSTATVKKAQKVESENEDSDSDSASGSDESSDESSDEPEPPKKGAKGKAVVEDTKGKSKAAPTKRK